MRVGRAGKRELGWARRPTLCAWWQGAWERDWEEGAGVPRWPRMCAWWQGAWNGDWEEGVGVGAKAEDVCVVAGCMEKGTGKGELGWGAEAMGGCLIEHVGSGLGRECWGVAWWLDGRCVALHVGDGLGRGSWSGRGGRSGARDSRAKIFSL